MKKIDLFDPAVTAAAHELLVRDLALQALADDTVLATAGPASVADAAGAFVRTASGQDDPCGWLTASKQRAERRYSDLLDSAGIPVVDLDTLRL